MNKVSPMAGTHMTNAYDPTSSTVLPAETVELIKRRDRVLGPSYRLFYQEPVAIAEAHGVNMYGLDGRTYLDAYNNVPVIGHSHPRVTELVSAQLSKLNTHTRYLTTPIIEYSERLLETFPQPLDRVTYTCTGSEAVDLAIRTAKYQTGNSGVIISEHAYHGTTTVTAGLTPSLGPNNQLGSDVITIPSIDTARTPVEDVERNLTATVDQAIRQLNESGAGVAAIIMDSIFSSDGVQVEPAGFLQSIVTAAHKAGALYIADEVQPGFGRTGHWWGFQRHGITPDLVVLGKPMGNGFPIAALVGTLDAQQKFGSAVRYFNTFAGSPVGIAAATAVLDVIEEDELITHAKHVGDRLISGLKELQAKHEKIFDVRGAGLFLAAEFRQDPDTLAPDPEFANRIVHGMRQEGILISASGPNEASLKIRPPLPFTSEDADYLMEVLDSVISQESQKP